MELSILEQAIATWNSQEFQNFMICSAYSAMIQTNGLLVHAYRNRSERVKEMMPLYEKGFLDTKPTIFNINELYTKE